MALDLNRRRFIETIGGSLALMYLPGCPKAARTSKPKKPLNFLLIVADDMNYDSTGVTGCSIPDITPHIDKLAGEGLHFLHGHVTISACQPSRQSMMTGRYPHNIGALGFDPIDLAIPTLQERLHEAGYLNGILSKVAHLQPKSKYCWDTVIERSQLGHGRNPSLFYRHAKKFFDGAREVGQPFCLMANSNDPHRPFSGSEREQPWIERMGGGTIPVADRHISPEEVEVPAFLPDIPDVRKEVAEYYTSTHRCDQSVGEILRALTESGFRDSTVVMFFSDNGMSFPFAKTNVYFNSTRTPWIVRWPGVIDEGLEDHEHFISGADLTPTILDAAGIDPIDGIDGRSFLPLLLGEKQQGRKQVFTVCYKTAGSQLFGMRCIQDRNFGYIFNDWADNEKVFRNEGQNGLSFRAMKRASKENIQLAQRVKLFQYRIPEELYHFGEDPDAMVNLIDEPQHRETLARLRSDMESEMSRTNDPLLGAFKKRVRQETG